MMLIKHLIYFSLSNSGALKAVIIGNMVYLISQLFDVLIYSKIKSYSSNIKWLCLRNIGSTLISQILDTTLITYGFGFTRVLPLDYAVEIIISTLVIKIYRCFDKRASVLHFSIYKAL